MNITICPKCGYERKAAEQVPDWQCPSCGVAYSKVKSSSASDDASATPPQSNAEGDSTSKNTMLHIASSLLVFGIVIGVFGSVEYYESGDIELVASKISLAKLEKDGWKGKRHITVGEHWKAYDHTLFSYKAIAGQTEARPDSKILYSYYPVLSTDHPYVKNIGKLVAKYGRLDKIPADLRPDIKNFSMLVKTQDFQKLSDIPDALQRGDSLTGIIAASYNGLSPDEKKTLREGFSHVNVDNIPVLEQGRQPDLKEHVMMLMYSGAAMIAVSAVLFFILFVRLAKLVNRKIRERFGNR